jgi:hypothetical protein
LSDFLVVFFEKEWLYKKYKSTNHQGVRPKLLGTVRFYGIMIQMIEKLWNWFLFYYFSITWTEEGSPSNLSLRLSYTQSQWQSKKKGCFFFWYRARLSEIRPAPAEVESGRPKLQYWKTWSEKGRESIGEIEREMKKDAKECEPELEWKEREKRSERMKEVKSKREKKRRERMSQLITEFFDWSIDPLINRLISQSNEAIKRSERDEKSDSWKPGNERMKATQGMWLL